MISIIKGGLLTAMALAAISFDMPAAGQSKPEEGIPVTDALVNDKCAGCHPSDGRGNLKQISWERTTPEGWQEALKRMVVSHGVNLTEREARSIIKYLSASHGLAPEEAKPLMYDPERRVHDESDVAADDVRNACARCHSFARPLSWRRSADDLKEFTGGHTATYGARGTGNAIAFLAKSTALHSPVWDAWSARSHKLSLAGRWLITAFLQGRGKFYGEMQIEAAGDDEFNTTVHLTSVRDGSTITRIGHTIVFGSYAWRGRSKGGVAQGGTAPGSDPSDPMTEAREVLWIAPDQSAIEGRWFWGQYQEFGFDVSMRRASSDPTLLLSDRPSLKVGTQANRVRLIGENIPAQIKPADLTLGAGVAVKRIVSHGPTEIVAEVDIAADAALGKHDIGLGRAVIPGGIAIYDRVDYIKVSPGSALAAFSDRDHAKGYQQFEAIGYQRGPDGEIHTPDDLELGPIDAAWTLEVFYRDGFGPSQDFVGTVSPAGFFTPVDPSPGNNFDVWVVATAKSEKDARGRALSSKSYMVLTVPMYTLNGRRYVRDLDRWVDDGPAQQ